MSNFFDHAPPSNSGGHKGCSMFPRQNSNLGVSVTFKALFPLATIILWSRVCKRSWATFIPATYHHLLHFNPFLIARDAPLAIYWQKLLKATVRLAHISYYRRLQGNPLYQSGLLTMCNPIIFKCLSCGLKHSYKPQPCADSRRASTFSSRSGFAGGAPLRLCGNTEIKQYNVSCDRCKDAWNARQREHRRREARRQRAVGRKSQGSIQKQ